MITATFSINDGPQLEVEAYGVELHTRSESNQAEGQIQLTVLRKPDEPFLFALNDRVTVYLDASPWFTGLADQGSVLASATDYRHAHILRDPWTVLENCQWRVLSAVPCHSATTAAGWRMLVEWQRERLAQYFTMPPWPATMPQLYYRQWPGITGPLAACVTKVMKPFILAGQSWDHSTIPPTMTLRNQGDLVLHLDKERNGIGQNINLTRRDDLRPASVEFAYTVHSDSVTDNDDWFFGEQLPIVPPPGLSPSLWPPDAIPGGYGSVLVLDAYIPASLITDGIARFVYEILSVPVWEGTFTVQTYLTAVDGSPPLHLAPGMTVNLSGESYNPDWATMNAVIQAVELDILTGLATVHVGANGHAALTDVMERARDLLAMKYYDRMTPKVPLGSTLRTVPGAGAGAGASAFTSGESYNGEGNMVIDVTVEMGTAAFLDDVLADVYLPLDLGTYFTIISTLGSNPAATTLNPTFTCVAANHLRISRNSLSPVPGSLCQWNLILVPH